MEIRILLCQNDLHTAQDSRTFDIAAMPNAENQHFCGATCCRIRYDVRACSHWLFQLKQLYFVDWAKESLRGVPDTRRGDPKL